MLNIISIEEKLSKEKIILLKLEAGIVSRTKSNNSLTNALMKHEAEHMIDIFKNERSNLKL